MKLEDEIKSGFRNEQHKALVNLYYTESILSGQFVSMLKKYGLATPQFNVLRILQGQLPEAVSIGLVKERMLTNNSDVSRIVDRLFKKGLVERKECDADRRQKDVYISQKGVELLEKIAICEKQHDEVLSNLSLKEVEQLNNLLDKIRN
ncbi:MAG: MarR family transcriptional regulator [Bacteroidetes bacterium]|nr:MAG: MarR family transcriptional regulator [Bacteroidota bacterium]